MSWFEAAAYARWAGVRLLTEAEWERAARGGAGGREYPWGNEAPSPRRANYDEGKVGHPTPVGLYPLGATPEGIQDLAGNVWEWCEDWYDPAKKEYRVTRGGSWDGLVTDLRGADRDYYLPEYRLDDLGFRVGREVNSP